VARITREKVEQILFEELGLGKDISYATFLAQLAKLLGALCLGYGRFMLLLTAIPSRFNGRLAFLFCGGMMFGVGWVLFGTGKREERAAASPPAEVLCGSGVR